MNCRCTLSSGGRIEALPASLKPRFLAGLTKQQLSTVLASAVHQTFKSGSVAVRQGETPTRFLLLTSGRAAHFVLTVDGTKVPMYWLMAGQIFGGSALLPEPTRYFANTETQTDGCALVWNRQAIRGLIAKFPVLMDNALSIAVTEQLAWQLAARISLACDDARTRMARLMIGLACGIGTSTRRGIEIAAVNEELAAASGVTPYTFSRILAEWKRAGVIIKRRGAILLLRPELLSLGT